VAWSPLVKEDFTSDYWKELWDWYDKGGDQHVAAYLAAFDLSRPKLSQATSLRSSRALENWRLAHP
jgi:hypothetical protein